jgi:hypothetical protein
MKSDDSMHFFIFNYFCDSISWTTILSFFTKAKTNARSKGPWEDGGDQLEKNKMEGTSWRRTRWRDQLEKKKRGDQELALEDPDERVQEFVVGAIF